ncbi:MAG: MAPEG family protein [Myxococcota bacterium]
MQLSLFAPALGLVLWTEVMLVWMLATRVSAVRKARIRLDPHAVRGAQMNTLPPIIRWKSDNYTHLLEQPTLFYVVCVGLALVGGGTAEALLAWSYVALRVVHSVHQALRNVILVRFAFFCVSTAVLIALTVLALVRLGAHFA